MELFKPITDIFDNGTYVKMFWVILILVVGAILIRFVNNVLKLLIQRLEPQQQLIIRKAVIYTLDLMLLVIVLSYAGINLTAILGTVGILGIVVGIASQSAIGNIIGGIFLLSEKAFQIGDVIKVDTHVGVVHSIDLLAIKLKTFDNLLMRIPNQTLLTTKLVNITKFPYRRLDFDIRVEMDADLENIKEILEQIVKTTDGCLSEPEPLITYKNFGPNGIEILLGVWFEKANYLIVKNGVFLRIQKDFLKKGIRIPYTTVNINSKENEPKITDAETQINELL